MCFSSSLTDYVITHGPQFVQNQRHWTKLDRDDHVKKAFSMTDGYVDMTFQEMSGAKMACLHRAPFLSLAWG